jgi:hypothetical protein
MVNDGHYAGERRPHSRVENGACVARSVTEMLKTLLLVLAGLGAGLVIAAWLQPSATPPLADMETARNATPAASAGSGSGARSDARLAALESAFAAEVERRVALEARVAELSAELGTLGEQPERAARGGEPAIGAPAGIEQMRARFRRDAASPEERQRRALEQLVAAGFSPDRAEWIERRTQELRMEALQAQYEARRDGRPEPSGLGDGALRAELGDAEYEQYLSATGRSTSVNVLGVLASSPAERSGLQPGDEIVAYNGRRVFDVAELNELTLGGASGESVVVDVRRNGQTLQLVMPRGPMGITGGFRGPPMRLER